MADGMSLADRVVSLAERQYGLVTRQQLLEAGVTSRSIEGLMRRRWFRPAGRGVYLAGPPSAAWWREMAVLLAHPSAVLSHWTAARLTALVPATEDAAEVCVIVPRGSSGRAPGVRALRTDGLHAAEWCTVRGLRATTPARTLFDLAVVLGRAGQTRRLEQLVARALNETLCTSNDISMVIQRHPGSRGAGLLRLVMGDDDSPALCRSEAEELLRQHLVGAELPPWRQNARVAGYEVDFVWSKERLVVEVDGYAWHSSRNRFEGDRARDVVLTATGYVVLRFTWRQVQSKPMSVVSRIAYMLGKHRAG